MQTPPPPPGPTRRRRPGPPPAEQRRHLSPSERNPGSSSSLDVVGNLLDKGIVVDLWAEARLLGIPLLSLEARVVVASIETYLFYAQEIMALPPIGRGPMAGPRAMGTTAGLAFETQGEQGLLSQPGDDRTPDELQALQAQAERRPEAFQQEAELVARVRALEAREQALTERERRLADRRDRGPQDAQDAGDEGDEAQNGDEAEPEEPEEPEEPAPRAGPRPQPRRGVAGRFAPRTR